MTIDATPRQAGALSIRPATWWTARRLHALLLAVSLIVPAGHFAVAALTNGGPDDFTNYAQRMEAAWGREYKRGRYMHKLIGQPKLAEAGVKLIDNAAFRDRMLKALYKKAQGPQHSF